jgi:DNA-binding LacI/PurR family transcriptional regulator
VLFRSAIHQVGSRLFELDLLPLFEKALAFKDATAWICANDSHAISAIAFLRKRNIRIPGDLSVVGFDNSPVDALENRLTSLDFNALGFILRILNFITRPPRPRGAFRHVPIEVEGVIIERGSAGQPNRR